MLQFPCITWYHISPRFSWSIQRIVVLLQNKHFLEEEKKESILLYLNLVLHIILVTSLNGFWLNMRHEIGGEFGICDLINSCVDINCNIQHDLHDQNIIHGRWYGLLIPAQVKKPISYSMINLSFMQLVIISKVPANLIHHIIEHIPDCISFWVSSGRYPIDVAIEEG